MAVAGKGQALATGASLWPQPSSSWPWLHLKADMEGGMPGSLGPSPARPGERWELRPLWSLTEALAAQHMEMSPDSFFDFPSLVWGSPAQYQLPPLPSARQQQPLRVDLFNGLLGPVESR